MPEGGKTKNKKKNRSTAKVKGADDKETDERAEGFLEKSAEQATDVLDPGKPQPNTPEPKITDKQGSETDREPDNGSSTSKEGDDQGQSVGDQAVQTHDEPETTIPDGSHSNEKLDALVRDRDSLRVEVTDLRESLEEIQSKHHADMEALQNKLDETERKKEHAEHQFQKLLERVNTIKSQLGERLKEDADELAQARSKIEELEEQNSTLTENFRSKCSKIDELSQTNKQQTQELNDLRERANLSQHNWLKEKAELAEQETYLQSEFEQAKEAMHNWEIIAMEERSIREDLGQKVMDLEEQVTSLKDDYEKASMDRDSQLSTVDGLQRALQEIQTARKQELRELVENSGSQLDELKQSLSSAEKKASQADRDLQDAQNELERVRPFEKEVKEKNLLIGKLRHEAVTLNDHLTKALRFLKKGKPEDNVDRHIVTNHLLHFLALDRSDAKKFQILQLIAALLGWTDEQREQAGLARPGTSSTSGKLRVPGTPHRTPSTPTLATEFMDNGNSSKESLAELWSNFLEQESQASQENSSAKP